MLLSHYLIWTRADGITAWAPEAAPLYARNLGKGSVAIFFMLTGYLYQAKLSAGWALAELPDLLLNRFLRIVPLASLSVGACATVAWIVAGRPTDPATLSTTAHALTAWLTFIGEPDLFGFAHSYVLNAGVLWSLAYEGVFYAFVFPIAALAAEARPRPWPMVAVPIAIVAGALLIRLAHPIGSGLVAFGTGMVVREVISCPPIAARLRSGASSTIALVGATLAIAYLPSPGLISLPCYALLFACCAAGAEFGILRHPLALTLGRWSYGIYLWHGLALFVAVRSAGEAHLALLSSVIAVTWRRLGQPSDG